MLIAYIMKSKPFHLSVKTSIMFFYNHHFAPSCADILHHLMKISTTFVQVADPEPMKRPVEV